MHLFRWRGLVYACLIACAACEESNGNAASEGRAWMLRGPKECALAAADSSPADVGLSNVESLDVDSRGRIYVGDRLKAGVVVLSPDGRYLRTIGKRGQGPGEFDYIRNVQVLPGDSLLVYDAGINRLSVFPPDSTGVSYVRNLAGLSRGPAPNWVEKLPGERAFFATHRNPFRAGQNAAPEDNRDQAVRILEWDGRTRRDSVLVVPTSQPLVARQGGAVAATTDPFGRPGLVRVGPGGKLFYGWGDSLSVQIYDLQGKRVGGFDLPYQGPPVTGNDVEDAGEDLDDLLRNTLREQAPERWPAFRSFIVDEHGNVWVALTAPAGEPTNWSVFDQGGKPLCSVRLPTNVDLRLIRGGKAYSVVTDDLDVPRIVVYRLSSSPGPGGG